MTKNAYTPAAAEALQIARGQRQTFEVAGATLTLVPIGMVERGEDGYHKDFGAMDERAIAALYVDLPTFRTAERFPVGLAMLTDEDTWSVYCNDTGFIAFDSLHTVEAVIAAAGYIARRYAEEVNARQHEREVAQRVAEAPDARTRELLST